MTSKPSYQDLEEKIKTLEQQISALQSYNSEDIPGGELLLSLIQSLPLNIYAKSITGHFIFANNYYCKSVNRSPEEILDKTDYDLHPEELAKKYLADDQVVINTGKTTSIEERWVAKIDEQNDTFVHVIKAPIYDAREQKGRTVIGTLGIFWDITEKKVAEIKLQRSEEKHRNILENIEEGYFELNKDNLITFFNDSFQSISGYAKNTLKKKYLLDILDKSSAEQLQTSILIVKNKQQTRFLEDIILLRNTKGTRTKQHIHLDLSLSPIVDQHLKTVGVRGVARDISDKLHAEKEKQKLEEQLNQSQKLESLGTLAGGIAHDFNNILFLITGYTDLALLDVMDKIDPAPKLEKIKEASTRATELVTQILTFARRNEKAHRPLNISDTIIEVDKLLRAALPASITIKKELDAIHECIVEGDETEIHQILMNLGMNAGHAIGNENGSISFRLEHIIVDNRLATMQVELSPGPYALLTISDTGSGIKKKDLKRIFEPFFTTKKTGEGTGLGLSMVHGIIKKMNGAITVYSEYGKGSAFQIYLPLSDDSNINEQDAPKDIIKGKQQHILLVDDDSEILEMVCGMLKDLNYRCTTAKNGLDALTKYREEPDNYDCILTDQTMPVMTGADMSRKVLEEDSSAKIILCTGFSHNITKEDAEIIGIKKHLNKPILLVELSQILDEIFTS